MEKREIFDNILGTLCLFGAHLLCKSPPTDETEVEEQAKYLYENNASFHMLVNVAHARINGLVKKGVKDGGRTDSDSG